MTHDYNRSLAPPRRVAVDGGLTNHSLMETALYAVSLGLLHLRLDLLYRVEHLRGVIGTLL